MKFISYQGIFFEGNSSQKLLEFQKDKLPKVVANLHCTFKFKPTRKETQDFFGALGNKDISLKVIGYASDGKNSGFEVELTDELKDVYLNRQKINIGGEIRERVTPPHITVSMSEDGKAVNTGFLEFEKLENPFYISGRAGIFAIDRDRGYSRVEYENPYKEFENNQFDEK